MLHYHIVVIGSGPAGHRAAIQAAKRGKHVALVERKPRLGGAGLQTGTIPSKALREIAYSATIGSRHGMRNVRPDFTTCRHNFLSESVIQKDIVIDKQESVFLNQLMRNGVVLIPGEAGFIDAHTLRIKTPQHEIQNIQADTIIIATGSRPRRPADVPFDKQRVLDSTSILHMQELPQRLSIVGGGVIACEFATIYASLGVDVTMIDSHAHILPFLCADISDNLATSMRQLGIQFVMNETIQTIVREGDRVVCHGDSHAIESECLLYALGRIPNTDGLGLQALAIECQARGWVKTNEYYQTNIAHIYAVGDVIGSPALAATGMEQGRIAALHACNADEKIISSHFPMAIYTIPEVAWVGKTSLILDQEDVDYVAGIALYRETARGQIIGDSNGMLKLLVDVSSRKLLGIHIVGESASELVHIGQMVMNLHGTVDDLIRHVFNYPTLAECYKIAALDCSGLLKRV